MWMAPGQGALLVLVGLAHVEHHRARLADLVGRASAVSTSRIRALVSRSRSRNVAIPKCYLVGRHFAPAEWSAQVGPVDLDGGDRRRHSPSGVVATSAGRTSLIEPRTTAPARSSYGVGWALTMTTVPPLRQASGTRPAAG